MSAMTHQCIPVTGLNGYQSLLASKLSSKADSKLPLRSRIFASESQLKRKLEAPKQAIVHVLSQEWALSDEVTQACLGKPPSSKPSYKLNLPSEGELS